MATTGALTRGIWERTKRFVMRWTRVGRLQLDRMDTKSALGGAYRDLGRLVADRFIDRDETTLDRAENTVSNDLQRVRNLRKELTDLEAEIARAKSE